MKIKNDKKRFEPRPEAEKVGPITDEQIAPRHFNDKRQQSLKGRRRQRHKHSTGHPSTRVYDCKVNSCTYDSFIYCFYFCFSVYLIALDRSLASDGFI